MAQLRVLAALVGPKCGSQHHTRQLTATVTPAPDKPTPLLTSAPALTLHTHTET